MLILRPFTYVVLFNTAIVTEKTVKNNPQSLTQLYSLNQCEIKVMIHFFFKDRTYLNKYTQIS